MMVVTDNGSNMIKAVKVANVQDCVTDEVDQDEMTIIRTVRRKMNIMMM